MLNILVNSKATSTMALSSRLRNSAIAKSVAILILFFITFLFLKGSPIRLSPLRTSNNGGLDFYTQPDPSRWTKTIWQTSKLPLRKLSGEEKGRVDIWSQLNPDYKHELMTDERMEAYVHQKYNGSEIESVYLELKDYILRADLIRYLLLLADGGVYNDLDVGCVQPIDTWLPKQFAEEAGVILGVEMDNKRGPDGRTLEGGTDLFELVNWTMMAKPGQPFIQSLVKRVIDNVYRDAKSQSTSLGKMEYTVRQVLSLTGPAALTAAFFDYASNLTDSPVTHKNFTKITEPKLVGEVVILPIHAFGATHQVEWAGLKPDNSRVLVHHYFKGRWKQDHLNTVDASEVYGKQHESISDIRGHKGTEQDDEEVVFLEEKVLEVKTERVTATGLHPLDTLKAKIE